MCKTYKFLLQKNTNAQPVWLVAAHAFIQQTMNIKYAN